MFWKYPSPWYSRPKCLTMIWWILPQRCIETEVASSQQQWVFFWDPSVLLCFFVWKHIDEIFWFQLQNELSGTRFFIQIIIRNYRFLLLFLMDCFFQPNNKTFVLLHVTWSLTLSELHCVSIFAQIWKHHRQHGCLSAEPCTGWTHILCQSGQSEFEQSFSWLWTIDSIIGQLYGFLFVVFHRKTALKCSVFSYISVSMFLTDSSTFNITDIEPNFGPRSGGKTHPFKLLLLFIAWDICLQITLCAMYFLSGTPITLHGNNLQLYGVFEIRLGQQICSLQSMWGEWMKFVPKEHHGSAFLPILFLQHLFLLSVKMTRYRADQKHCMNQLWQ